MKNAVFWDVRPCICYVNQRFGRTYLLYLQGRKISERGTSAGSSTLVLIPMPFLKKVRVSLQEAVIHHRF
jgi:hypothetical protein